MSDVDLRIKYRAKSFNDIIGQNSNLDIIKKKIIKKRLRPGLVITGQYGTGKTTVANIAARAIQCDNLDPVTLTPCYCCEGCKLEYFAFATHMYWAIDGTRFNTEQFDYLCENLIYYTGNKYRVVYVDELHRLNITLQEKFLKLVEDEFYDTTVFILVYANDKAYKVCEPLIQRLPVVKMLVPSTTEIRTWLQTICQNEGIDVDKPETLDLIAEYSANIPRRCLGNLEKFAILDEPVSEDSVHKILNVRR